MFGICLLTRCETVDNDGGSASDISWTREKPTSEFCDRTVLRDFISESRRDWTALWDARGKNCVLAVKKKLNIIPSSLSHTTRVLGGEWWAIVMLCESWEAALIVKHGDYFYSPSQPRFSAVAGYRTRHSVLINNFNFGFSHKWLFRFNSCVSFPLESCICRWRGRFKLF